MEPPTASTHRVFDSLEHTLGSVTPQVVGHGVNTIQGGLHTQAPNEVAGIVLVEVKGDLGHVLPVLVPGERVKTGLEEYSIHIIHTYEVLVRI